MGRAARNGHIPNKQRRLGRRKSRRPDFTRARDRTCQPGKRRARADEGPRRSTRPRGRQRQHSTPALSGEEELWLSRSSKPGDEGVRPLGTALSHAPSLLPLRGSPEKQEACGTRERLPRPSWVAQPSREETPAPGHAR